MQMPGNEAFFGRISVKQGIYETIKDWIIERRLKPGERFRECVKEQGNPMPLLKADKQFHSCILDAAENEYIKDFCDVLWIHIQRLEYSFFRDTPMEASLDEHEQLIRALERRDGYFASLCMKAHWERTMLVINSLNMDEAQ